VSADEETPEAAEPVPCTVCRGTGTLISNLGGSPSNVPCAWCEGTGTFLPDHDAQGTLRAAAAAAGEISGSPAPPVAETD
jgi:DnaJ-class molecular chaperone